jgi:hypothetical protein
VLVSKRKDLDRVRNAVEVRCSIEMGSDGRQMQAQPTTQRWRCGSVSHHEDTGMRAVWATIVGTNQDFYRVGPTRGGLL